MRVKAVGVCGSDIPRVLYVGAHKEKIIIGHEFSGQIVLKGNNVTKWKEGDRVTVAPLIPCGKCDSCLKGDYSLCSDYDYFGSRRDGAMAEYVAVPENNLVPLPDNVSYEAGAMVDPAANAWHALWRAGLREGEDIAVFGVGPIGMFVIQAARLAGASRIVAIDIVPEKLELALKLGADEAIEGHNANVSHKIVDAIGKQPEVAIDLTGVPSVQGEAINTVGKRGRVVLVGISHKGLNLSEEQVDRILRYELIVQGSWNSFSKPFPGREWFETVELLSSGKLLAESIISHKFDLAEAPRIFGEIKEGRLRNYNKILFLP